MLGICFNFKLSVYSFVSGSEFYIEVFGSYGQTIYKISSWFSVSLW